MGKIVETGAADDIFSRPLHPYTKALISAAEAMQPGEEREQIILAGDVPSPADPPSGCRFHPRCPVAFDRCPTEEPELRQMGRGHRVACHLY